MTIASDASSKSFKGRDNAFNNDNISNGLHQRHFFFISYVWWGSYPIETCVILLTSLKNLRDDARIS